ncbi:hypothetical protein ACXWRS_11910, partial [Streptococcus pyogenes]
IIYLFHYTKKRIQIKHFFSSLLPFPLLPSSPFPLFLFLPSFLLPPFFLFLPPPPPFSFPLPFPPLFPLFLSLLSSPSL